MAVNPVDALFAGAPSSNAAAQPDQRHAAVDALFAGSPASGSASDPSAGGSHLQVGPWMTPIPTPQWLDRLLSGTGQGMENVGRHAANLVGLESDKDLEQDAALDKPLLNTTAGKVGNFIGTTAATAPIMGGVGDLAGAAGGMLARVAANPLSRGMLEGAAQGLVTADPGQRLQGTLGGGVLGGMLPGAGKIGGKLLRGFARTPEAQALLDRGIDLTPGLLNPEGQRNASEEAAQSLPFVGSMIARARNNALRGYQRSVVGEAVAPGAKVGAKDVADMLTDAYNSFQPLYDQAKGFPVKPVIMRAGADTPLSAVFKAAVSDKSALSSGAERRQASDFLNNEMSRFNGMSDSLLSIRSNIRAKIREAALDGKTAQAQLLKNGEVGLTHALDSQLPTKAITALRAADSKYGTYKVIEDAVARSKDRSLGMSPTNLSEAVKSATPQPIYARGGGGPLRDLARAGKAVFDVRSPPTGARVETLLPGMAATMSHPLLVAPMALARLGLTATARGRALAAGTSGLQRGIGTQIGAAQQALGPLGMKLIGRYSRAGLGAAALPRLPAFSLTR